MRTVSANRDVSPIIPPTPQLSLIASFHGRKIRASDRADQRLAGGDYNLLARGGSSCVLHQEIDELCKIAR
jgi:hypothetical protein